MVIIWEQGISHDMGGSFHAVWQNLKLGIMKEEVLTDDYIEIEYSIVGTNRRFKTETDLIAALKAVGRA